MACYQHPSREDLQEISTGTGVYLDGRPTSGQARVRIFLWRPGTCKDHVLRSEAGMIFSYSGKLTRAVRGFKSCGLCRTVDGDRREILYAREATGDDVADIEPANVPVWA